MVVSSPLVEINRRIRVTLGIALGVSSILVSGHPNLGKALDVAGALVILSRICGTCVLPAGRETRSAPSCAALAPLQGISALRVAFSPTPRYHWLTSATRFQVPPCP